LRVTRDSNARPRLIGPRPCCRFGESGVLCTAALARANGGGDLWQRNA
jgi:hypothetical protein